MFLQAFRPVLKSVARADVRIRIRGSVIRVRIDEACIRTVIRVTAEQDTSRATNLFILTFPQHTGRDGGRASLYGWKQRREPMFANVNEGALSEFAKAKPAPAPPFALPPNRKPLSVSAVGMLVL